jgi:Leucine-rich repeat (LRR) protein
MPWLVNANVASLSMTNCSLRFFPGPEAGLPKLQNVDIRDNNISLVKKSTARLFSTMFTLSMAGNPTICGYLLGFICTCAPGFFGNGFCEPVCLPPTDPRFTFTTCSAVTSVFNIGTVCKVFFDFPYGKQEAVNPTVCSPFNDMETAAWSVPLSLRPFDFPEMFTLSLDKLCVVSAFGEFDCSKILLQYNMSLSVNNSVTSDIHLLLARSSNLTSIPTMSVSVFVGILFILVNFFLQNAVVVNLHLPDNLISRVARKDLASMFFYGLQTLVLDNNPITVIEADAFRNLQHLRELQLSFTNIRTLPSGLLASLPVLSVLVMRHSLPLPGTIPENWLDNITDLPVLYRLSRLDVLGQAKLSKFFENLAPRSLIFLKNLRSVSLSGAPFLSGLIPESIRNIPALDTLDLTQCSLQRLEPWPRSTGFNISSLYLSYNYWTVVAPGTFETMPKLTSLAMAVFADNIQCTLRSKGNITCNCPFQTHAVGPGFCSPACPSVTNQQNCTPAPAYGANCTQKCHNSTSTTSQLTCELNRTWTLPACALTNISIGNADALMGEQAKQSTALFVAIAVGACLGLIAILLLLFLWKKRKEVLQGPILLSTQSGKSKMSFRNKHPNDSSNSMPLAGSPTSDVFSRNNSAIEHLFVLIFNGRFAEKPLLAARSEFSGIEVTRRNIKLERIIGQGQRSEIQLARLSPARNQGPLLVAVKSISPFASDDKVAVLVPRGNVPSNDEVLLVEARLLFQLRHANIVQVLGVVTKSTPALVCLEYMANGDLKTYLRLVGRSVGRFLWLFALLF